MGLLGIFKLSQQPNRQPAKGYSLASARQAIFYLASSAEDQDIREAALNHIRDNLSYDKKDALKSRYRSLDQVTSYAIETRLSKFEPAECKNDQEFLLWVTNKPFCSHKDNLVAIKHIADQEKIKDIVINNDQFYSSDICLIAISRLLDQDLIIEVTTKGRDDFGDVLHKAFERIPTDQEMLRKLIRKAVSLPIRILAIENLDDKKLLWKIAVKNRHPEIRLAAMKRINDTEIFNIVAKQDDFSYNRMYALKKVDNQKVISRLARYDNDKLVRSKAIKKLRDNRILRKLAKNDSDLDIRETAAYQLQDEELINKIRSLKKAIEEQENHKYQKIINEEIDEAKEFFTNMSIVRFERSLYNVSIQNGSIRDILKEIKKHDHFHHYNPRENWRIISHESGNDHASFQINVRNYMADSGWVYNEYTFLIIERIGENEFIWYQEKETRESN